MEIKDYLKYYWLEKEYLEKEVRAFFEKKGFLTAEQFFSIVFWKSKRPAGLIRSGLLDEAIEKLTKSIFDAKGDTDEEKDSKRLCILLKQHGFGIAMASAVLTILYPRRFTVYDYRVLEQINKRIKKTGGVPIPKIENITSCKRQKEVYWEYAKAVKETASELSLRNCDRALWAKSWYEDLQKFLGNQP